MARIPAIEARLLRWAEACTVGDGSGYATMSVLHKDWSPPGGGQTPSLKVARTSDVHETARAVAQLSFKLHQALIVHYCKRGTVQRQCEEIGCAESTLHLRIERAHAELQALLTAGSFCNMESSG